MRNQLLPLRVGWNRPATKCSGCLAEIPEGAPHLYLQKEGPPPTTALCQRCLEWALGQVRQHQLDPREVRALQAAFVRE